MLTSGILTFSESEKIPHVTFLPFVVSFSVLIKQNISKAKIFATESFLPETGKPSYQEKVLSLRKKKSSEVSREVPVVISESPEQNTLFL